MTFEPFPETCSNCNAPVETASAITVTPSQKSAWWEFSNGVRCIGGKQYPAPRGCTSCRFIWTIYPGTERVFRIPMGT